MAWKDVELKRTAYRNPNPLITVNKCGTLRINRAAQLAYGLEGFSHVRVKEDDEQERVLGLELLNEGGKGTLTFKKVDKGEGTAKVISSPSLIKQFRMKVGAYPLTQDEETGFLVFSFEQAKEGEVANENKKAKPAAARKAS